MVIMDCWLRELKCCLNCSGSSNDSAANVVSVHSTHKPLTRCHDTPTVAPTHLPKAGNNFALRLSMSRKFLVAFHFFGPCNQLTLMKLRASHFYCILSGDCNQLQTV